MPMAWFATMLPSLFSNLNEISSRNKKFQNASKKMIELIKKDYYDASRNSNVTSLASLYINDTNLNHEMVISDFNIIIESGIDTTSFTAQIGVLLLAKYPNIQERIYNELKSVFDNNNNNEFRLSKITQLHQFRAFIYETMRITTPVPDAGPHTCIKDVRCIKYKSINNNNTNNNDNDNEYEILCDFVDCNVWDQVDTKSGIINNESVKIEYDYMIEKDSIVEPNLGYISNYNKNLWDDVSKLNLKHFLKEKANENNYDNGKKFEFFRNDNFCSFGIGTRSCPGQALARKELYIFFGNLILKYKIMEQNNNPNDIKFNYTFGGVSLSLENQIPVKICKRK